MHEDGYLSLCNCLSWSVSVQRWGGGRADETVLFSSYIICSVWRAGSSDQNFNEILFIFLLSFLFIFKDTTHTHTHTLRQTHTCTHDAAWILSKPSLEDFMSNKVDRGSLSLHEVKPAGQWFDLWLSTGSWYKCAFYITAALLWTPGVSFRSFQIIYIFQEEILINLYCKSLPCVV